MAQDLATPQRNIDALQRRIVITLRRIAATAYLPRLHDPEKRHCRIRPCRNRQVLAARDLKEVVEVGGTQ